MMRRAALAVVPAALLAVVLVGAGLPALAETADPQHFLERNGCAYGPQLEGAAQAAGLAPAALAARAAEALQSGKAEQNGDWTVFDAGLCTSHLPQIDSPYAISDAFLAPFIRRVEAPAEDAGCYLENWPAAFASLGLDKDAANAAGMRFLAAEIIAGRMGFYGENPLATPIGFQTIALEGCDAGLRAQAIRAASGDLDRLFDTYLRMSYAENPCGNGDSGTARFAVSTRDMSKNVWLFLEAKIVTLAAGWHEGLTARDKGTPRPPLCHMAQ